MQYDDPSGITVLLDSAHRHTFPFRTFPQVRQQFEAFLRMS
jgi:hypothetical protein